MTTVPTSSQRAHAPSMSTSRKITAPSDTQTSTQPVSRTVRTGDRPFAETSPLNSHPPSPFDPRLTREEIAVSLHDEAGTDEDDDSLEQQHNRRPRYGSLGSVAPLQVNPSPSLQRRDSFPPDNGHALLKGDQGHDRTQTPAPTARNSAYRRRSLTFNTSRGPVPPISFYNKREPVAVAASGPSHPQHESWGTGRASSETAFVDDRRRSRDIEDGRSSSELGERGFTFLASPSAPRIGGNDGGRPPPPAPNPPPLRSPSPGPSLQRAYHYLPWALFMSSPLKNHLVAALGEFVGTTMFLFFAFAGTTVANVNVIGIAGFAGDGSNADVIVEESPTTDAATALLSIQRLVFISLCFGFSLMVNVWIFFRISGGLFNPAVTLALLLTRAINSIRAVFLLIAQLAGGIAAAALVVGLFPTPLNVRTTLSNSTSIPRGLFVEAILTVELVFTILMLAKEKHKSTFMAPVGIGLALFVAELVGVQWTGGSLNPARSFGPCVVTGVFEHEHWIYWVGPLIGTLVAVAFYFVFKALEYETANPGQDDSDIPEKQGHPPKHDPTPSGGALAHSTGQGYGTKQHSARHRQRWAAERVLRDLGYEYVGPRQDPVGRISIDFERGSGGPYGGRFGGWFEGHRGDDEHGRAARMV